MVASTVSPVLRTGRWVALLLGIGYGHQRNHTLTMVRMGEREREIGKFDKSTNRTCDRELLIT